MLVLLYTACTLLQRCEYHPITWTSGHFSSNTFLKCNSGLVPWFYTSRHFSGCAWRPLGYQEHNSKVIATPLILSTLHDVYRSSAFLGDGLGPTLLWFLHPMMCVFSRKLRIQRPLHCSRFGEAAEESHILWWRSLRADPLTVLGIGVDAIHWTGN